ncbi:hypothetical protein L3N51_02462 [Metallosphaera sp. J1]|nr:hypothetical protein [Metallosphaera javensis (ex Hofmann et al. 2022)]
MLEEAVKKGVSLTEIEELVLQAAMEAERDAYLEEHDDVKNGTYFSAEDQGRRAEAEGSKDEKEGLQAKDFA